jgi:beta-1,4-mannosyl-glycoprotein beta-1,4-N-acetylglucosaminyltransferase
MPGIFWENRISPETQQPERFKNCWHNERHQRNCLIRGLSDMQPDDVAIISDADEIVRPDVVSFIRNDDVHSLWGMRMPCFNFKFNYMWVKPLMYNVFAQAIRGDYISKFSNFSVLRESYGQVWVQRPIHFDNGTEMTVQHGGWHFSSLGDEKNLVNKFRNFAHSEMETMADEININELIEKGKSCMQLDYGFEAVKFDSYFPNAVLQNQEKYQHLILKNTKRSITEILGTIL